MSRKGFMKPLKKRQTTGRKAVREFYHEQRKYSPDQVQAQSKDKHGVRIALKDLNY